LEVGRGSRKVAAVTVSPAELKATAGHFKDAGLERLAETANVAQFASFAPGADARLRFSRIFEEDSRVRQRGLDGLADLLLSRSAEHSVNVRSFHPEQPKSHDFIYGLKNTDDVIANVRRLASAGLYTIVNETIDVNDGGVSGVAASGIIEFAPGDTPRAVEKPGTASFEYELGLSVLETVYGFKPSLPFESTLRLEFSIHPLKRGFRNEHTIIWEIEKVEAICLEAQLVWPNKFSRFIGDKAFGLLIADALGLPVPHTSVVGRHVAPFSFGRRTETQEYWTRTAPVEQVPGHFTTQRGWLDPFKLLSKEDPDGVSIASVLSQEGVDAVFAGAALETETGDIVIEGVKGTGDAFMQGREAPALLPDQVGRDVAELHREARKSLGPLRFEWVHDGSRVWIVQMHRGTSASSGRTIYPGHPLVEHEFPVSEGLEALRRLIATFDPARDGVVLLGEVGLTSHLGDVLRRARIPSRIVALP